jgi:aquaporin Z
LSAPVLGTPRREKAADDGTTAEEEAMPAYRAYPTELIGTFFLVFTVGTCLRAQAPLAPLAIGAILMVMVYAGGHISGGHYNPALTMAAFVRRRIGAVTAVGYWVAQVVGALLAAVLADWVVSPRTAPTLAPSGRALATALVGEALFTFALAYVMLNVATSVSHPDNSFYGLAIGFTVAAGVVAVGRITGATFNPAVAIGAALAGLISWAAALLYLVVQLMVGIAAGFVFLALSPNELPAPARRPAEVAR